MTYKHGAYIGFAAGFFAWLVLEGVFVFTPNPELVKSLLLVIGSVFTGIALILGIAYVFRQKSALTTTGDGFFYGFVAVFDIFSFVSSILAGRLPLSLESILLMFL
jgi:hypothetical protein